MKSTWDKFKDIVDMIGKIFLPIALLLVGQTYANQQALSVQERADFDKLTTIIEHLDSEKQRDQEHALLELVYFVNRCRFSMVMVPALQETTKDPNVAVAQEAGRVLNTAIVTCSDARAMAQQAAESNSDLAASFASIQQTVPAISQSINFEKLPASVFIHVKSDAQQQQADDAKRVLERNGYGVPAIRMVSVEPSSRELRYFHQNDEEAKETAKIVAILGLANVAEVRAKQVPNFESKMPPRRYELWLPN
jgi:hypothetical protein